MGGGVGPLALHSGKAFSPFESFSKVTMNEQVSANHSRPLLGLGPGRAGKVWAWIVLFSVE